MKMSVNILTLNIMWRCGKDQGPPRGPRDPPVWTVDIHICTSSFALWLNTEHVHTWSLSPTAGCTLLANASAQWLGTRTYIFVVIICQENALLLITLGFRMLCLQCLKIIFNVSPLGNELYFSLSQFKLNKWVKFHSQCFILISYSVGQFNYYLAIKY